MGGREEVRRILARFYQALAADPMVGFHFAGRELEAIIDGQHGFLMKAFGETTVFAGKHPSLAHLGLAPILRGQFDRRLVLLELHDHHRKVLKGRRRSAGGRTSSSTSTTRVTASCRANALARSITTGRSSRRLWQ